MARRGGARGPVLDSATSMVRRRPTRVEGAIHRGFARWCQELVRRKSLRHMWTSSIFTIKKPSLAVSSQSAPSVPHMARQGIASSEFGDYGAITPASMLRTELLGVISGALAQIRPDHPLS